MSNSFPKNHSVKKITRRCFAVIVACFMALAAFPLHAETAMTIYQNPYFVGKKNAFPNHIQDFIERTGYDRALTAEVKNGLVTIDFRGLKAPHFFAMWPDKKWWVKSGAYIEYIDRAYFDRGLYKDVRGYYEFNWMAADTKGELHVTVYVCKDYELAQTLFLLTARGMTNAMRLPWDKCEKQIGTFCAAGVENKFHFFLYKNIVVILKNATNKQISERTAQWLSDVLKGFPLIPMNAPLQFRREPYSTPVFEYLGSEAPAAGDSLRMGADGDDDD